MVLEGADHEVMEAATLGEARGRLGAERVELVILDVRVGEENGLDLLREIPRETPVIVISGNATVGTRCARPARAPSTPGEGRSYRDVLLLRVRNALERRAMTAEVATMRAQRWDLRRAGAASCRSWPARSPRSRRPRSACSITGESGTGKELIARRHPREASALASGPFVKVNCAAIPPELIESELLGHERGAFNRRHRQAARPVRGRRGGTMFLDELSGVHVDRGAGQGLRVLQTGELTRRRRRTQASASDCRVARGRPTRTWSARSPPARFREDLFLPAERRAHPLAAAARPPAGTCPSWPPPSSSVLAARTASAPSGSRPSGGRSSAT